MRWMKVLCFMVRLSFLEFVNVEDVEGKEECADGVWPASELGAEVDLVGCVGLEVEVDLLRIEGRFLGAVGACGKGGLALCAGEDKG